MNRRPVHELCDRIEDVLALLIDAGNRLDEALGAREVDVSSYSAASVALRIARGAVMTAGTYVPGTLLLTEQERMEAREAEVRA